MDARNPAGFGSLKEKCLDLLLMAGSRFGARMRFLQLLRGVRAPARL